MTPFPHVGPGFIGRGSVAHLNPMNARRLDERALMFDDDPAYRAEVKARIEAEANQEEAA